MPRAVAPFDIDHSQQQPPSHEEAGVQYVAAHLDKTFRGDIEAQSTVEMLSVRSDDGAAGYVALERITGAVHGRSGSFALLHMGTMTGDGYWGRWPVAPGSGTGELAGISGEARIEIGSDGAHTLHLDYQIA